MNDDVHDAHGDRDGRDGRGPEREVARLLRSALTVQAPPLAPETVARVVEKAVDAAATRRSPRPDVHRGFPYWAIAFSAGCLAAVTALGLTFPYGGPIPADLVRALAVVIPVANVGLCPAAALVIAWQRRSSYATQQQ